MASLNFTATLSGLKSELARGVVTGPLAVMPDTARLVVRLKIDGESIANGTFDAHGFAVAMYKSGDFTTGRKMSDRANAAAGVTAVKAVKAVKPPADVKAALTALKAVKPVVKVAKVRKSRKVAPVVEPPVVKAEPRKLPESCKPGSREWPARNICDAARKAAMAHYNLTTNPGWQVWLGFVPPADMPAAAQAYLDAQAI